MAADVVSRAGQPVTIFEKRKSAGRKLLIAGSSGLNISNDLPLERFAEFYSGPREFWSRVLEAFPPEAWLRFIEELGIPTFKGSTGRYFVEDMKASRLLKAWVDRLRAAGVGYEFERECTGFARSPSGRLDLSFREGATVEVDAAVFALGGGSWEPTESPLRWPAIFKAHGLRFQEFTPSNVGYRVAWSPGFLKEAEGQPLKRVVVTSARRRREGDVMVTRYGLEGTPIYFAGLTGPVQLDLKPDLEIHAILTRMQSGTENLSPIRAIKRYLNLCPAALALLFHESPPEILKDPQPERLVERLKAFPLQLLGPQPLAEAISAAGGLALDELDPEFMLRDFAGVFAAGEMLDWDVPTGGFLLQACVAQGFLAGQGVLKFLQANIK